MRKQFQNHVHFKTILTKAPQNKPNSAPQYPFRAMLPTVFSFSKSIHAMLPTVSSFQKHKSARKVTRDFPSFSRYCT
jgi:hypothetical protein